MSEYREIPGPIEGYKIFNEDMTCRDFQFKEGVINELGNDAPLSLCNNGFHFCKYPSGVLAYYNAGRVWKIRAYDVLEMPEEPGADYKLVCRRIELVSEVNLDGNGNTGNWNTGNRNTGYFHIGDAPLAFFGKPVKDEGRINWGLASELGDALMSDEPFDPTPYLSLPNATKTYISRLHKDHIERRKKAKENR